VKESLIQAKELVQEVRALQAAIQPLLTKKKSETPTPGKPLDLEKVASNVDDAAREATSLVRETRALAESPTAMQNVDRVLGRTTRNLSDTGHEVIDHAAWRAVQIVLLIAALVVVYKVVKGLITRRHAAKAT
jgi:uncharacterized protein (DUF2252 family)